MAATDMSDVAGADHQQQQRQQQQQQRYGIEKQLAKLKKAVDEEKNYYEAHQMYRTVVNRYIKQKKYNDALVLLHSGAETLLKHQQSGSGADLALYFVDTLVTSHTVVTDDVRAHLEGLLALLPETESGRKRVVQSAVSWSARYGSCPTGDPHLHHFVGTMYWKEKNFAEVEHHLSLGTEASARLLGRMLCEWAVKSGNPEHFGHYLARGILRLLAQKKIKQGRIAFEAFCSDFRALHSGIVLGTEQFQPDGEGSEKELVAVYPIPLVNFCQLLLLTVQRDAADVFELLKQRYLAILKEDHEIVELFDKVGQVFFNLQPHRAPNLLANIMSLFTSPEGGTPAAGGVDVD